MANFKKIGDIAFVEAMTENDGVLIEQNGSLKKVKAKEVGGGKRNVVILLNEATETVTKNSSSSGFPSWNSTITIPGLSDYFSNGKNFKLRVISYVGTSTSVGVSEVEIMPEVHAGNWLVSHKGGNFEYFSVSPEGILTFYFGTSSHAEETILRVEVETYE